MTKTPKRVELDARALPAPRPAAAKHAAGVELALLRHRVADILSSPPLERLLDVSVSGVKLRAEAHLELGAPLTLAIAGKVYLGAEVVWRQGPVVGIDFAKQPRQVARIMAAFLPAGHLLPAGRA